MSSWLIKYPCYCRGKLYSRDGFESLGGYSAEMKLISSANNLNAHLLYKVRPGDLIASLDRDGKYREACEALQSIETLVMVTYLPLPVLKRTVRTVELIRGRPITATKATTEKIKIDYGLIEELIKRKGEMKGLIDRKG